MRVIAKVADRLLSAVVPEITAGACCSLNGKHYVAPCPCYKPLHQPYQKNCVVDCYCHGICGACYKILGNC